MEAIIRHFLEFFVAAAEVFIIFYLLDAFFERRCKKSCYIIGALVTIFLFTVDFYFDAMGFIVGGIIISILVIIFTSYSGFSELLPKLLICVFIYWILDLGETIPVMLCLLLFEETNYITALQENLTIYIISCIGSKLVSFVLAFIIKQASKKRIVSFKLKYKIFLLICPIISFLIYSYWSFFIYQGEKNDQIFTLGIAVSLFIINVINIKLLNWISEDAEDNAKTLMVKEYLKNERRHIVKLDEQNNQVRKMSHDLKHHMMTIYSLLSLEKYFDAKNYAKNLTEGVINETKMIDTGNTLIDSVISEYQAQAETYGIKINFNININTNLPIEEIGLVIILGNALKNAIEYCVKEDIGVIDVTLKNNDRFLLIEIINSLKEVTKEMKVGIFKTNKNDQLIHGIGIQSMRETAKSMHGEIIIECRDKKFILSAIVPLKNYIPQ